MQQCWFTKGAIMKHNNAMPKKPGCQELITTKELCLRLKVSPGTIRGWRYLGMPHYNLNPIRGFRPTLRYDFDLIMSWINERFLRGKK